MNPFTSVATRRTSDQVVEQIHDAITAGHYAENERLPSERELAETFEVSRGVIREAIKVLNGMGLIESRQGSGLYVKTDPAPAISRALTMSLERDETQVHQLYDVRRSLESLGARLAAENRTEDDLNTFAQITTELPSNLSADQRLLREGQDDASFHHSVAQASGNPYLVVLLQAVRELLTTMFPIPPGRLQQAANARNTHTAIATAIADRDGELAAKLMGEHIDRSQAAVLALVGIIE